MPFSRPELRLFTLLLLPLDDAEEEAEVDDDEVFVFSFDFFCLPFDSGLVFERGFWDFSDMPIKSIVIAF